MFIYGLNEIYNPNPKVSKNEMPENITMVVYLNIPSEHFTEELKTLLNNIFKALKTGSENVLLVFENTLEENRYRNIKSPSLKKIISFGVPPEKFGINTTPYMYEMQQIKDLKLVVSDELEVISKNQALKQKLWAELQKMFELK